MAVSVIMTIHSFIDGFCYVLIYVSLFTQKVAIQQYNAHKKRKKTEKQTYDTKKQCPGRINLQNKTHEESTIKHKIKHTIIIAIQNQT